MRQLRVRYFDGDTAAQRGAAGRGGEEGGRRSVEAISREMILSLSERDTRELLVPVVPPRYQIEQTDTCICDRADTGEEVGNE